MEQIAQSALPVLYVGMGIMVAYTLFEFVYLVWVRRQTPFREHFLQPLKNLLFVALNGALLTRFAPFIAVAAFATAGAALAPVSLPDAWYSWVFALLIYEFWYWVQHYLGHKVRLLWCIHSPHHAPPTINMLVGHNHHALESLLYFPLFFGFMTGLCGVPVAMVLVINFIDMLWGSLLHISPDMVKRRYGPLEHFMQTPSYHRVHHARNLRYMDTNYNSITLFWDWVFGTLQPLRDEEPVQYGITRPVRADSFWDVQFGEFRALWRDVKQAPGIVNKLAYLLMPPGWSHIGQHQTVSAQKQALHSTGAAN